MSVSRTPAEVADAIDTECYACVVGVATGPESHSESCPVRDIPMPVQDGQWGPKWDAYDRQCEVRRNQP